MSNTNRPLSPHLSVYRPQLTSVLSILHRITGFGLALGALLVTWWLCAAMSGPRAFECFQGFTHSIIGELMLFCWIYALSFHFMNGIRHLVWDTGRGLTLKSAYAGGWAVVVLSVVATAVIWLAA
ncbi:MAG: succinate dehydrogenase, cytochrome b556 subunit [Alphaproteobacteria bacterium]|nr:succinate dehydrogenase, cytochrome b556 subunit [Alphaproteobacteria bacterium]